VHGFTTAFMWSAIIFAVGAVVALVAFTGGASTTHTVGEPTGEPVVVH
jgi:hypothetical protein